MINTADLDRMLAIMHQRGLEKLLVREGGVLLALTLDTLHDPATVRRDVSVRATALGRFLSRHPRHIQPITAVGDHVAADTIIGFLENGSVLLPVVAGKAGQLSSIDAEDGSVVGFGAPVATISTEG